MNSLVKSLIQPILEQEGQKIALVPGGFKPPTVGHFSLVDEVAKNSNIDKVIVLIGHNCLLFLIKNARQYLLQRKKNQPNN